MSHALKAEFKLLLNDDAEIFNWLVEDGLHGIWYCDPKQPNEVWISGAFWKILGYNEDQLQNNYNDYQDQFTTIINNIHQESILSGQSSFDNSLYFKDALNDFIVLHCAGKIISAKKGHTRIALKFTREDNVNKSYMLNEIRELRRLNEIYDATNQVSRVGGWKYDAITNRSIWTSVIYDILEVGYDYDPNSRKRFSFYKEGWSRDTIEALFKDAIENGRPFNVELQVVTEKGSEKWVRAFGRPEMENGKCVRLYGAFQDISFEKERQIEYHLTKERFETIYNNSSIGIVLINAHSSKVLMANPATLEIFGFEGEDKADMSNVSYRELIHPEDLEMATSKREKLLAGLLSNYTMESRFFTRSGHIIWCRVNTSLVRGHNSEEDLIIAQVEDITISKRLEEISSENSNRFISAFEYSPNGMALVGLDGSWLMVNEALSQMLSYSREELMKLTFQDVTHPDDLDADIRLLQKTLDNKIKTYSIEKRYFDKDGNTVYGLLNVSLIRDAEGHPLYFISQINNISKRVKAQQELQESLNELESFMKATTQVAIIQADLNGIVTKFNKGAQNILGYHPDELIGKESVAKFHDQAEISARARRLEQKYGKPFSDFDVFTFRPRQGKFDAADWTYIRKDGSRLTVHLVVTSILDHKGEIIGFVGIATDISFLKEMEISLMEERDKAKAASKSKSEFLANMSHEIRTPLNGVIGFSDLLMKSELNESQRKYMHMVNTSAHSLLDIINDILDFSKIEAGKLELNEEKTDIIQLCSQTIDIVKHQAHAKSLEILLDIAPDLNRYIYADPVRLRQILVNLLGNAVKFTLEGEVELKVRSVAGKNDEMLFAFSIRDTGIGIASQNIEKIFSAFDQEDASTTRKYGGTGLGITISNKLLSLMGSSLHVESEVGKGSTFSFKVRFRAEKDSTYIPQTKVNVKNVLLVDDNANNLTILKDMLAVGGIKTTLASNGIEALEILENHQNFDLAIVDYNMPYLSGTDLVKQVRETLQLGAEKLPVMLLHSSIDDEKLIQACIDLDIRFNVTKPILSDDLFELLNNIHKTDTAIALAEATNETDGFDSTFNVLIAEDNPVNQMLAKTIIQKMLPNAAIILAENGLEAVKAFQTQSLDIIFMDIQMPEMSGFEATEKIRSIETPQTHIPIVAITARALVGEREECLKLGMNDYITKPINYETLQEIIRKHLVNPYKDKQTLS